MKQNYYTLISHFEWVKGIKKNYINLFEFIKNVALRLLALYAFAFRYKHGMMEWYLGK